MIPFNKFVLVLYIIMTIILMEMYYFSSHVSYIFNIFIHSFLNTQTLMQFSVWTGKYLQDIKFEIDKVLIKNSKCCKNPGAALF